MGTILTILIGLVIVFFLIMLSMGLVVALGIIFVLVLVAGGISLLFGDGDFIQSHHSVVTTDVDPEIQNVPQAFNTCLLNEKLDLCRTKFTHWDKDNSAIVQSLAKQVREELGVRGARAGTYTGQTKDWNGEVTVTIDQVTDFSKKEGVSEHYVITPDDDGHFKIKELNWDY